MQERRKIGMIAGGDDIICDTIWAPFCKISAKYWAGGKTIFSPPLQILRGWLFQIIKGFPLGYGKESKTSYQ